MVRRIWLDPVTGKGRATARYIEIKPGQQFTVVTLDRDGLVYQANTDGRPNEAELRSGLADALERYRGTVCNYLWVHGYAGSIFHSSGPSVIVLPTPFHLADQVAEALRDAELHGDFTALEKLTAELQSAVPLEAWLAPGERLLRRGIDFFSTPSGLLEFLRMRAEERGLRLNGRAEPGGVWVRPTMSRHNQELRKRSPDQYADFADPAPYAAHIDRDDAPLRPYLDQPRAASATDADPVTFHPTTLELPRARRCPCGYHGSGDDPGHQAAHMQWSTGFPIPKNLPWFGRDIAVVTATSPIRWRKLAHQCAVLPRRENSYDFASFAIGDGTPDAVNSRVYLYQHQGRVIGFASVYDTDKASWHPFGNEPAQEPGNKPQPTSGQEPSKAAPRPEDSTLRPAVSVVFTAHTWRRYGVARDLVRAIAIDAGIDPADLAWTTPFSDAGLALAKSIAPAGSWVT